VISSDMSLDVENKIINMLKTKLYDLTIRNEF